MPVHGPSGVGAGLSGVVCCLSCSSRRTLRPCALARSCSVVARSPSKRGLGVFDESSRSATHSHLRSLPHPDLLRARDDDCTLLSERTGWRRFADDAGHGFCNGGGHGFWKVGGLCWVIVQKTAARGARRVIRDVRVTGRLGDTLASRPIAGSFAATTGPIRRKRSCESQKVAAMMLAALCLGEWRLRAIFDESTRQRSRPEDLRLRRCGSWAGATERPRAQSRWAPARYAGARAPGSEFAAAPRD
jgi:hypothetical protein